MIQFNTPEWFVLIPRLLAAAWKYRRLRLASPLRLLLQACLLLALAQPALDRGGKGMDLWADPPISRADWLLWQHSHSGRVDGVAGPVDLNTFCGDSAAWRTALSRWAGQ